MSSNLNDKDNCMKKTKNIKVVSAPAKKHLEQPVHMPMFFPLSIEQEGKVPSLVPAARPILSWPPKRSLISNDSESDEP